jgi:hypothetical protein
MARLLTDSRPHGFALLTIKANLLRLADNCYDPHLPPFPVSLVLFGYYSHKWNVASFCDERGRKFSVNGMCKDMVGDCLCLFQRYIFGNTQENHKNLSQDSSWVRVPMKVDSVARKLNKECPNTNLFVSAIHL